MRIPPPLSRIIHLPQHKAPNATLFSNVRRDNARFTESTKTRSLLTLSNSRRATPQLFHHQQSQRRNESAAGLLSPAQSYNKKTLCLLRQQLQGSCMRSSMMTTRTLMTEANPQQNPVVKYSGDNDDRVTPQEYKVRVGTAIRTLREELPQFFQNGLCTTSIYAPNVRLIEASHTNVSLQGKTVYFLLAGAVRWSFKMWFRDIEFEIQSIRVNDRGGRGISGLDSGNDNGNTVATCTGTEPPTLLQLHGSKQGNEDHVEDRKQLRDIVRSTGVDGINTDQGAGAGREPSLPATTVTVRWTLKGTTRPSVVLTTSGPTSPPPSSYAGVFVYELDDWGLISEHRIENIMPSPSPEAIERAFAWWGWLLSRTRPAATATFNNAAASRKRLGLD